MDRRKLRWIVLGLALASGLVLLGRWAWFPDEHLNTIATKTVAPVATRSAATPPEASAKPPPVPPSAAPKAAIGGTFRGRAIDSITRKPVEQFEVQLRPAEKSPVRRAEPITKSFRSATGHFAWTHAPVGTWNVSVMAHGYQRFELRNLAIASGAATPETLLPMLRGHMLKGRVFDESTRAGIHSARITFRESHVERISTKAFERPRVRSEQDGSFVLDGVPSGKVTLSVSANNYAPREIDLVVDEKTSTVDVGLSRGGGISGYLTAADGTPVKGTALLGDIDQRMGFQRETNDAGEFSFEQLPAGRYRLTGRAKSGTVSKDIILAHNERAEGIVLALGKGRSVRGTVRGVQPERFKEVFVLLHTENRKAVFTSELDDQGAYAMHGVPPGRAELQAHLSTDRERNATVEIPADADLTFDIDFASGSGFQLSGRVTQAGNAATGATVWAWPMDREQDSYRALTSSNGTYRIENLTEGEYRVSVDAGAGVVRRVKVAGDTAFDIEVPSTQLAGQVLEEGSSVPIVGAGVHVVGVRDEPWIRVYRESDHFGQFDVSGFDPADILISVYKPGYEMFRQRLAYGSPLTGMEYRLRRGNGVELRIQGADGSKTPPNVFLSEKIGEASGIGLWIRLDDNGVGSIPSALRGSKLSITVPGHVPAIIEKWDAQPLELRVTRR